MPMALEQNKSNTSSQSRARIFRTASNVKDFAKLIVPGKCRPLFHLGDRRQRSRGADETLDKVFKGLLREANRELATLLRDVRDGSGTALLDGAGSRAIRDLLRRALQCATKQYMLQTELGNLALK